MGSLKTFKFGAKQMTAIVSIIKSEQGAKTRITFGVTGKNREESGCHLPLPASAVFVIASGAKQSLFSYTWILDCFVPPFLLGDGGWVVSAGSGKRTEKNPSGTPCHLPLQERLLHSQTYFLFPKKCVFALLFRNQDIYILCYNWKI